VFPERGFSTIAVARWADPVLGGDGSFTSAELGGSLALPLSRKTSLGLCAFVGSDFSGFLMVNGELPPERYFSIRQQGMFYGLASRSDRALGNSVASMAIELRTRVGRLNSIPSLLGGDFFMLANLSLGSARITGEPNNDFLPLRWNGSLGLGGRLGDHFGMLLTAGLIGDEEMLAAVRPALSLELGTFGDFLEDRR
jgi:hypothetical protein